MPLDADEVLPISQIYGDLDLAEEPVAKLRKEEITGTKPLDSIADMFYVNKKLKRIFVKGEAGHGKSVLCLKLSEVWANEKRVKDSAQSNIIDDRKEEKEFHFSQNIDNESIQSYQAENLNTKQSQSSPTHITEDDIKLSQCMSVYDLVFHVPLYQAECLPEGSSVVDLVCDNMPECGENDKEKIKQILGDPNIPCLIILDGLDEYKLSSESRVKGFLQRGLVNTVVLCSLRPWWMVDLELGLDTDHDKVIQISGLKRESVGKVFRNILVQFRRLEQDSALYRAVQKKLDECCKLSTIDSLTKIPLILTLLCHVWYEECKNSVVGQDGGAGEHGSKTSHFITSLYLRLLKVTIRRSEKKHDDVKKYILEKLRNPPTMQNKPVILSEPKGDQTDFRRIIGFFNVIKPIGKLFLEALVKETHLHFPKDTIEQDIGPQILDFALKAGIFSLKKASCNSDEEMVSVDFHKSIQEFIAAFYIACGGEAAFGLFGEHCITIDKVMKLSDVIMFVCGLDPVVGCRLSEHIKNVVNNDADIMQYREKRYQYKKRSDYEVDAGSKKVKELYKGQCKWYSEMKQNLSYIRNTGPIPTLHVTDICLVENRNDWRIDDVGVDDVRVASELVSMEDNSIVFVYLFEVKHPVGSIIRHLPGCQHLTTLHIGKIKDPQDRKLLAEVLPKLVQLQCVEFSSEYAEDDTAVVHAIQHLTALRCIKLKWITLIDTVTLPSQLQKVHLEGVKHADHILQSLSGCTGLTSLYVLRLETTKECEVLASVLPRLSHLQFIHYAGSAGYFFYKGYDCPCVSADLEACVCEPADHVYAAVVCALQHLTQLTHIKLSCLYIVRTLLLTPRMTQLQKLKLERLKMSPEDFVTILKLAPQLTHLKLSDVDLTDYIDNMSPLVIPQTLQKVELNSVKMISGKWTEFFSSLQHATQLTHIKLLRINLCNACYLYPLSIIQEVESFITQQGLQRNANIALVASYMRWQEFVDSLCRLKQTVHVTLHSTDIDEYLLRVLLKSHHITDF